MLDISIEMEGLAEISGFEQSGVQTESDKPDNQISSIVSQLSTPTLEILHNIALVARCLRLLAFDILSVFKSQNYNSFYNVQGDYPDLPA